MACAQSRPEGQIDMKYLGKVNGRDDISRLSYSELEELCAEIRSEIIDSVSRTGGHLASSLGVVELTVALHRVFDAYSDRIIFDVGHQSYAHKLLTGRYEKFGTLREYGGIGGFPDPSESKADPFRTGHSSTSVSAALGMARARTLSGDGYSVVAVIGDGALTGGMAYEALADAGQSREPVIVILNDNEMSIDRSAGGVERLLSDLRMRPGYTRLKRKIRGVTGEKGLFYNFIHRTKDFIKRILLENNIFEALGFTYLGPVDGHNLSRLCSIFESARNYDGPVLIHVLTKKGKGYKFAEEDPVSFHGIASGLDVASGQLPVLGSGYSMRFGQALCRMAEGDPRLCAITAAMRCGTGLDTFAERFPNRFFDVGIAEEHAATMAAGLASCGMLPVFAVYSTFAQRCYDMMLHDIALQKLHVVFAIDRGGLVGSDGATHQGIFDISFLSSIPGMRVYAPSSLAELEEMLKTAIYEDEGPVALRYPRGGERRWTGMACGAAEVIRCGSDVTVVSYGDMINEVLDACDLLSGVEPEVIKLGVVCPIDCSSVIESVKRTGALVVAEDCVKNGSVGVTIAAALAEAGVDAETRLINLGNRFIPHGSVRRLMQEYHIDAAAIADAIGEVVRGKAEA